MTTNYERIKKLRIQVSNFLTECCCKLGFHLWVQTSTMSRYCVCCKRYQIYDVCKGWQWLQSESEEK